MNRRQLAAWVAVGVVLGVALVACLRVTSAHADTPGVHMVPGVVLTPAPIPMTVVDHTRGQWPGLATAVDGWNTSPYAHLTIRPTCEARVFCVTVRARNAGPTSWGAITAPKGHNRAVVTVNTRMANRWPTPADKAAVMCHELGHALGIPHPTNGDRKIGPDTPGCIAGTNPTLTTPTPSYADLTALELVARGQRWGEGWGAIGRLSVTERRNLYGTGC